MSLVSRTALTFLAGLVAVPMTPVTRTSHYPGGARGDPRRLRRRARRRLTSLPDQLTYIHPGFNLKIASVTNFAPGKKPVVEIFMTDDLKAPLDRTGILTPGVISVRFIPAVWDETKKYYMNYIGYNADPAKNQNPSRDNTGTFQDLEVGHYKYTFNFTPSRDDGSDEAPHARRDGLAQHDGHRREELLRGPAVPRLRPRDERGGRDVERVHAREMQPVSRPARAARRQLP